VGKITHPGFRFSCVSAMMRQVLQQDGAVYPQPVDKCCGQSVVKNRRPGFIMRNNERFSGGRMWWAFAHSFAQAVDKSVDNL
jgi:hypothetical protein